MFQLNKQNHPPALATSLMGTSFQKGLDHGSLADKASDPWKKIIGQDQAVSFLKEICNGIRLGDLSSPILFQSRAGNGKSTLARALSREAGMHFEQLECGPELRGVDLVKKLKRMDSASVLFCDEMHSMRKKVQELLYSAIDSGLVPQLKHGQIHRCAPPTGIQPFMLVGATNEPGKLLPALRSRMLPVVLEEYSQESLRKIVIEKGKSFFIQFTEHGIQTIANASGGSPRRVMQILQSIHVCSASWRLEQEMTAQRDTDPERTSLTINGTINSSDADDFLGEPISFDGTNTGMPRSQSFYTTVPDEFVERTLSWLSLDAHGLNATQRKILSAIKQQGRATIHLLASILGVDQVFTREQLMELRAGCFVTAAPGRGWELTAKGKRVTDSVLTTNNSQ